LTTPALLNRVDLGMFWLLDRFQGVAFVSGLSAALLAAEFAQAARGRFA
jgi:hypothetical protein